MKVLKTSEDTIVVAFQNTAVANTQHAQARYEQEWDGPRARYHGPSLFYVQLDSLKIFAWYKKGPTRDR